MELADYLEQLTQEGSRESQGSFSIDYTRALEELSQRLFHDPTSWLVKLLQSAAGAGARSIHARPLRDRLEVAFTAPGWSSAAFAHLEELLHQPFVTSEQAALGHFLRAFHASRAARPQTLGWAVTDAEGGFTYWVDGQEVQRKEVASRPGPGCDCVFTLRPQTPSGWKEEEKVLTARCALSSVQIRWGRRLLNPSVPQVTKPLLLDRIYLSRQPAPELLHLPHLTEVPSLVYDLGGGYKDHYSQGPTLLHQWRSYRPTWEHRLWDAEPAPNFPISESDFIQEIFGVPKTAYPVNHGVIRAGRLEGRNNGYQILYVHGLDQFMLGAELPQGRFGKRRAPCAQAWLRYPVQPKGDSQLVVLQDGALLDPLPIEVGLVGARLFLADTKIKTDLSGLVPLRDERVEAVERWLQSEASQCRKEIRKALRWGSKYGYSDSAVAQITRLHQLDRE